MKKALITYLSKSGTTKYFAHNMEKYISEKEIEVTAKSIYDVKPEDIEQHDYILIGCWTHGLFIAFQHPDKDWVKWAKQLPYLDNKKIGLFTTYKLATGSMFRKMEKYLPYPNISLVMKSKGEELEDNHKHLIDNFLA